jgi:hypothetical protein
MNGEKLKKNTPKYTLPEKVINTGQITLDSIDGILGDNFSTEESFFWVFQKWLWSIFKMSFVLIIIVFFIWIIWTPNEDLKNPKINVSEEVMSKIKLGGGIPDAKKRPFSPTSTKDVFLATKWNNQIKNVQIVKLKNLPAEGIFWIKKASAFFDIPANLFAKGDSLTIRQKKIESTLSEIEKLLNQSQGFKINFNEQIGTFSQNIKQEENIAKQSGKEVTVAFQKADVVNAEQSLFNKITAEQKVAILSNQMKWYKTVFFEIEKYDRGLQTFYENIVANKAALIQDIQVVNFPNDPFSRTISPTEWRNGNED